MSLIQQKKYVSLPCSSSGDPSFVQVYCIDVGLPLATKLITICSSSIPTAVDDGGGVNFGGSNERNIKIINHQIP